jgi:hypothetical protein
MVYMGWERRETEETCLEEGEKKRKRTGEKRYKNKVNKKVDGQRKQKPEKKHEGEVATERVQKGRSRVKKRKEKGKSYRGNNNRSKLGIKE